jgi:dihydrofolate reductase (trimethoprim resistance protein)
MKKPSNFEYEYGRLLRKKSGSQWLGRVVGFYSTEQTPEGYALESVYHKNTVQIYPKQALIPADLP